MPRWLRVVLGEILVVGIPVAATLLSHPTAFSFAVPTALVASCALPLRLRWPWLAMLFCLPALAGGLGWPPAIIALYRIGRVSRSWTVVVAWVCVGLAAMLLPLHLKVAMPWPDRVWSVAFAVVGLAGPAAFGALVEVRRRLRESLSEVRRARSAELDARLESARAAERARIAREIHDAVGHHATLIAVQSAALAATAPDDATREAALRLRVLAKESLAEMRAALGLINDSRPPLGLADLPKLLTRVCRAGLRIEFDGDIDGDGDDVDPAVGRAIYRIVQEALTNVTKHAPASAVRVKLVRDGAHVLISVVNGHPTRPAPRPDDTGGTGLEGLAERVRAVGGTLRTSTLPDGGFSVLAELPISAPTKVESARSTSGGTTDQMAEP
ncbi:MAG TPA: histidine kinase [Actinophytocola sp.]|uniref:sensor histidine kinase n=1 Tax=Actinophytocola sp. TaxID=1872138 RepID=UPI002DDD3F97|nr:histidine kinase [Actinophytocola sp.]HEV2780785.1 histidine kinase [Actinophytocola sp.]